MPRDARHVTQATTSTTTDVMLLALMEATFQLLQYVQLAILPARLVQAQVKRFEELFFSLERESEFLMLNCFLKAQLAHLATI